MTDFAQARRMMVEGQIRTNDVTDLRVLAAFAEAPGAVLYLVGSGNQRVLIAERGQTRHRYVPEAQRVLGGLAPNPPDETQPWTICITNGPTQYLYTSDSEPGRIYKMTLDGTIVGMMGESGRGANQFNWIHSLACPSDDVLYVADMNNWRVLKLVMRATARSSSAR